MNSLVRHRKKQVYRPETDLSDQIDRFRAMKKQEQTHYAYRNYIRNPQSTLISSQTKDLIEWREKICQWTYSVIDHFELHRETVAISIDLFDRFIATRGNRCDGDLALIISLTTLYIAIKIHERKRIKLSTLTQLSRGQFRAKDIELMELDILQALSWLVHPPTVSEFVTLYLKFLPPEVQGPVRSEIFEQTRYLGELAVCDPFFIEHDSSTIAFAAILNVLEDNVSYDLMPHSSRERFLRDLQTHILLQRGKATVRLARNRLQTMQKVSGANNNRGNKENEQNSSRSKRNEKGQGEVLASSNDSLGSKGSKGTSSRRIRADSTDSMSVCSRGSKGSKGSKGSRGRGIFTRARAGSLVLPC
jgi:hypothetical protein